MPRKHEQPVITFDAFVDGLPPASTRVERGNPLSTDRHRASARRLVNELRTALGGTDPVATSSMWPAVIAELTGYNGTDWARVRLDGLAGVAALAPAPTPKED